jgi:hypothetical protein
MAAKEGHLGYMMPLRTPNSVAQKRTRIRRRTTFSLTLPSLMTPRRACQLTSRLALRHVTPKAAATERIVILRVYNTFALPASYSVSLLILFFE